MIGQRLRRLGLLVGSITAVALFFTAPGAYANWSDQYPWSGTSRVGYAAGCGGFTSGNIVRNWQGVLVIGGTLSGWSQVDGAFGPNTTSATANWQTQQALGSDGCVGYYSWNKAQKGSDKVFVRFDNAWYYYPHTVFVSQYACNWGGGNCEKWYYEQPLHTGNAVMPEVFSSTGGFNCTSSFNDDLWYAYISGRGWVPWYGPGCGAISTSNYHQSSAP
jgi:hypothetical protein